MLKEKMITLPKGAVELTDRVAQLEEGTRIHGVLIRELQSTILGLSLKLTSFLEGKGDNTHNE